MKDRILGALACLLILCAWATFRSASADSEIRGYGHLVLPRLTTAPAAESAGIAWVDSEGFLQFTDTSLNGHDRIRLTQKAHAAWFISASGTADLTAATPAQIPVGAISEASSGHEFSLSGSNLQYDGTSSRDFACMFTFTLTSDTVNTLLTTYLYVDGGEPRSRAGRGPAQDRDRG